MSNQPRWLFSHDLPVRIWELVGKQYHLRHVLNSSDTSSFTAVGWAINGKYAYRFSRDGISKQYCDVINLETGEAETPTFNPQYPFNSAYEISGSSEHLAWTNGAIAQIYYHEIGSDTSGNEIIVRRFTPGVGWAETKVYFFNTRRPTLFASPIVLPNQVVRWPIMRLKNNIANNTQFGFADYDGITNELSVTILATVTGPSDLSQTANLFLFESEPKPDGQIVCITGFNSIADQAGIYAKWRFNSTGLEESGSFATNYPLRHIRSGRFINGRLHVTVGSNVPNPSASIRVNTTDSFIVVPNGQKLYLSSTKNHPASTQSYDYDLVSSITEPPTIFTEVANEYALQWRFNTSFGSNMRFGATRISLDVTAIDTAFMIAELYGSTERSTATASYRPRRVGVETFGQFFTKPSYYANEEFLLAGDPFKMALRIYATVASGEAPTEEMRLATVDFPYLNYQGPTQTIYVKGYDSASSVTLGSWFDEDDYYFSTYDTTTLLRTTPDEYETAVWVSGFELPGTSKATLEAVTNLVSQAFTVIPVGATLASASMLNAAVISEVLASSSLVVTGTLTGSAFALKAGVAILSASAALNADAKLIFTANATLVASSAFSGDISLLSYATASLDVLVVFNAEAGLLVRAEVFLSSAVSLAAQGSVTKAAAADLSVQVNMAATAQVENYSAATLVASASIAASGRVSHWVDSTLGVAANLTSSAYVNARVSAHLQVQVSLFSGAVVSAWARSTLGAEAELDAVPQRLTYGSVGLEGTAAFEGSALRMAWGQSALNAQAALSGVAHLVLFGASSIQAQSSLGAFGVRVVIGASLKVTAATLTANATRVALASAAVASSVVLSAAASVTEHVYAQAALATGTSLASNAVIGKRVGAELSTKTTLSSQAFVSRGITASLQAKATLAATSEVTKRAAANLASYATVNSIGIRVFRVQSETQAIANFTPTGVRVLRVHATGEVITVFSAGAYLVKYAEAALLSDVSLGSIAYVGKSIQATLGSYTVLGGEAIRIALGQANLETQAWLSALPYATELYADLRTETLLTAKARRFRRIRFNQNTHVLPLEGLASRVTKLKETDVNPLLVIKVRVEPEYGTEANPSVTETKTRLS